jgi:hypothetical protein
VHRRLLWSVIRVVASLIHVHSSTCILFLHECNRQHDGHPENIPPPIEGNAVYGQAQDLQYIDMAYYDMAHPPIPPAVSSAYPLHIIYASLMNNFEQDHVAPYELHGYGINNYVGVPQAGPAQAHAIALPAPVCTFSFSYSQI